MPMLRKTLGDAHSPYIISLMNLIETQSKFTINTWCLDYAEAHILPIYERHYPNDPRPLAVIATARARQSGKISPKEANPVIFDWCNTALAIDDNPIARAAARAIGLCASSTHSPSHAMGLVYYGTAAIAYDRVGLNQPADVYDQIASVECAKMEAALQSLATINDPTINTKSENV